MNENPIVYVVINKALKMSAGKAAAQAVHAAMMLGERGNHFKSYTRRSVIVLGAENAEQIGNLWEYLDNAGIYSEYYIDEGVNEVDAYSITALAVEPLDKNIEANRQIFEQFSLFNTDYEDEEDTPFDKAYIALSKATFINGRPWYVRKTLNWLWKQR